MTTYHGLIKWHLDTTNSEATIRFSSLMIERPNGWSYAMTEIQLKNKFIRMVKEELGADTKVTIQQVSVHTDKVLTILPCD